MGHNIELVEERFRIDRNTDWSNKGVLKEMKHKTTFQKRNA